MADESLEVRTTQAFAYAMSRGLSREMSQDFAQECALKWLLGARKYETPFQYLYVDFLRAHGSGVGFHDKRDHMRQAKRLSDVGDIVSDAPDAFETWNFALRAELKKLQERARICVVLHYQWGLTEKEIGHVLGVTESRVCQILGEVAKKLRRRV